MPQTIDVDTSAVAVPDAYQRLVEAIGQPALRGRIRDAVLRAQVASVEVVYSESQPASTQDGDVLTAGAGYGSPWTWRIERIWVREETAAAGATVVFAGTVEKDA